MLCLKVGKRCISYDSMVFLDDNPFERNLVRENIPDILVPELPNDPSDYLEYLYKENLFETASFSNADKDRTKQYQVEIKRVASSKKFTDEDDYLKSLNMVSEVTGFTSYNIPRVAQLSQRSNQFNLRTVRYTESDINSIENDPTQKGFAFNLKDKFGDNGLIAVIILANNISKKFPKYIPIDTDKALFIDTWLMSCRVLKRKMENFTLNNVVKWAQDNGYKKIYGEYVPTVKNRMVKEHYDNLGFIKCEVKDKYIWILDVDSYQPRRCNILKI